MFLITFVDTGHPPLSKSKEWVVEKSVWSILPSVGDRVKLVDRTLTIDSKSVLHTHTLVEATLYGHEE